MSENEVIQLDDLELDQMSDSPSPNLVKKVKVVNDDRRSQFYCIVFFFFTTIGSVLWALSEGGLYGHGLIRGKYLGEECSRWNGRDCVEGLYCAAGVCNDHLSDENKTIYVLNNTCEICPPPVKCPPTTVYKKVSFFDFNEYPSYYLRQNASDPDLKLIKDISYGACKELCSKSSRCTAVSYHGLFHECHLRKQNDYTKDDLMKGLAGYGFWIAAFKIIVY